MKGMIVIAVVMTVMILLIGCVGAGKGSDAQKTSKTTPESIGISESDLPIIEVPETAVDDKDSGITEPE